MIDLLGATESSFGQFNALTISTTLAVVTVTLALRSISRPSRFPPGPRGLPIVGSIYSFTDVPQTIFKEWAKKYGDIFGFKVGQRWMVIINRQALIKEAIIKQGVDFADRPDFYSMRILTDGFKDIAFSSYSDTWKLHRKLAHSALRHFATGKPLQNLISSAYPKIEKKLAETKERPTNPKDLLNLLLYNILSQMCFGRSAELEDPGVTEFKDINERFNESLGLGLAADFFPWAEHIPTSGRRSLLKMNDEFITLLNEQIRRTESEYDPENINNFYSLLRKAQDDARKEGENVDQLTDTHVFQTISDIFGAGTQTSQETLYWGLALITTYPEIQAKIHAEIDDVIGRDRHPNINDRGNLPYTEATLYEIMRYSSIVPLSLPHATTRDTEFNGYVIPKGAIVMINLHSMHFDPQMWEEPEKFRPEHFLDASGTIREHPPSFLPFGAGRRSCLGEAVAKADLFLIFTWFLQNYTFKKAPGKESEDIIKLNPKAPFSRFLSDYEIMIEERE